jgi:hypothetical protein
MTKGLHFRTTSNARPRASRRLNFKPDAENRTDRSFSTEIAQPENAWLYRSTSEFLALFF